MLDRRLAGGSKMKKAADVGGGDAIGLAFFQGFHFLLQQPVGKFGLQDLVGARRAAALVRIGDGGELEAQPRQ